MSRIRVGLQLYTVRDDCARDFKGTVKAVAQMGYEGVELAGNFGLTAQEVKALMADCKLEIAGNHSPLDDLRYKLDEVIEWNQAVGNQRIICPWLPEDFQKRGAEGYREAGQILDGVGAKLREKGMSLSYHNHSFEFSGKEGDLYFLDVLYASSSPQNLKAEIDTYWVEHGGCSVIDYLKRYAGRIELLHIKDMLNDENRSFAEIGAGILHWDKVFAAAPEAGVEWYLVEQDLCAGPPLESARKSLEFLKSKGLL
jgi:sugar phosphate isomerase/epimerase